MSARRLFLLFTFIALGGTALLFNNCAGGLKTVEGEASQSSEGVGDSGFSGKMSAHVDSVSTDGKVWGFAQDALHKSSLIKVFIYVNGPVGVGTYLGVAVANVASVGTYAGHYFSYQLPADAMNGKGQQLYVYGNSAAPENIIAPSPITYAAYTPKAEAYFNQNIAPTTSGDCTRCHGWTYRTLFYGPLMNPSPFAGGTATTNRMIRKLGGLEGHTGGNFCPGGLDTGICAAVQGWWNAEFQ